MVISHSYVSLPEGRGGQTQLDRERSQRRGGETAEGSGRAEERMDLWMDSRTGNDSHLKWLLI